MQDLTRRLHDVSQDVIVNIDCGTLRGVEVSALKRMKKWLNH
jgi:DNA-directed RNA polymerase subunit beta'